RTRLLARPCAGLLPERRRRPRAAEAVDRAAALGVHGVRLRDRVVRQRPGRLLDRPPWALPLLRHGDLDPLPRGRARDGAAGGGLLLALRPLGPRRGGRALLRRARRG